MAKEKNSKRSQPTATKTNNGPSGPATLMKQYVTAGSTEEIQRIGDKIIESDNEANTDGLKDAEKKFHKELREDKIAETQNDANFAQPES